MKKIMIRSVWLLALGFVCLQEMYLEGAAEGFSPGSKDSSVFYKITTKEGVTGYLLGSVHKGFDKPFYDRMKRVLKPYVEKCTDFFPEVGRSLISSPSHPEGGVETLVSQLLLERKDHNIFSLDTLLICNKMKAFHRNLLLRFSKNQRDCFDLIQKQGLSIIIQNYKNGVAIHLENLNYALSCLKGLNLSLFQSIEQLSNEKPYDISLGGRNELWMKRLGVYSFSKPFFIICGAAHLPGDKGMVSLLKQEGFVLEPIVLWGKK
ncbi:TraB/GumN family protein [Candidatus Babeliales bacterium]|nr:TraB/GumN family protein [Candidatus Babeliales bacterium]